MRVAVTGARGRLGRALIEALEEAPFTGPLGPTAWGRPAFDLDTMTPAAAAALLDRDRPEVVVHAAAWTDVDGCARDPELAMRRNGAATGIVAEACAARGVDLVLVSTNEVFDGRRTDGAGYGRTIPSPINAYGREQAGRRAGATAAYGPSRSLPDSPSCAPAGSTAPGNDFPAKIAGSALRARDPG